MDYRAGPQWSGTFLLNKYQNIVNYDNLMYIYRNNNAAMKKNNLPPVALQLSHPDATFYSVVLDGDKVSGLFDAHDAKQPFEISFQTFLESAYKCGVIADYADGQIYIPGDRTDRDARQWASFWLVETAGTKDSFNVLSDAVYSELANELSDELSEVHRATPATIADKLFRSRDAAFCDAVLKLARIIKAVDVYQGEVEAANPA